MRKNIKTIHYKIRDEKLQYDINREAGKISALSSRKIDQYECFKCEEMLSSNLKFTYSPSGKALEKQAEKQVDALKSLIVSNKTDELKLIEGIFPKKPAE